MNFCSLFRMVPLRTSILGALTACLSVIVFPLAHAYEPEGIHWPSNQAIELDLQLGNPQGTLIDGSTSWDQVVTAAAGIWNPYLGSAVQFTTKETNFTPAQRDGKNSVFFDTSVFGEGFGDDTLATTAYFYNTNTGVATEADVVFNVAQSFNSYRGPLRANGSATVYDLRRVALHELGHVLGLAHVTQGTPSIMQPDITDLDTIQADDIAGVRSIYGYTAPAPPVIDKELSTSGLINEPFACRIVATNNPTSYQAVDLPPGLKVNTTTGIISGTPTVVGTFDVPVQATNSAGTASGTLHLTFDDTLKIAGDLNSVAYVGRPYYYQVATTGQPTSFHSFNAALPAGLALNPYTGLISGTPTVAGDFRFQIEADGALSEDSQVFELVIAYDATLSTVQSVGDVSALLKGIDGNLYGATSFGGVNGSGSIFKLSVDGALTTLYSFASQGPDDLGDLHQAPDGSFYGTATRGGTNYAGTVFKLAADGTMTTLVNFPKLPPDSTTTPNVLLASDGNYYGTIPPFIFGITNPGGWVYKLTPEGVFTYLYQFNGTDGFSPSPLIQAADGNFYGTTFRGGSNNLGSIFMVTPAGVLTTLHSFTSSEGANPVAALLQASDGDFYGTTTAGGHGNGTVFKMTADGTLTTMHAFTDVEGRPPTAALVQDSDGNFYGSASGYYVGLALGGSASTIYKLMPDGTLTIVHKFASNEGTPTSLPLVPDGAGNFFGVNTGGMNGAGDFVGGAVFKETPSTVPLVYAPPPVVIPTATLATAIPQVIVSGGGVAEFMVSISAVQDHDVKINYTIKGTATNGTEYVQLKGTKKIKAGLLSKPIKVFPQGDLGGARKKTVVLTLAPGDGYTVGTTGKLKVKLVSGQ